MDDTERGILLGELKAFRESTQGELREIKEELKKHSEFRWKVAGIVAAITTAFQVAIAYLKLKE